METANVKFPRASRGHLSGAAITQWLFTFVHLAPISPLAIVSYTVWGNVSLPATSLFERGAVP